MTTTIFDKILAGEIPCKKVYEDDSVFAFHDVQPQAPVHVLVIPKTKVTRFHELLQQDDDLVGRLFKGAAKVAEELDLDPKGYRVVINNGRDAQQSVDYIHLHLLAGRTLSWPPG